MHVSFKSSLITPPPIIQKYIFQSIAANAGWFIEGEGDNSPIQIQFKGKQTVKFEKRADNSFYCSISEQVFSEFNRFLRCEDSLDPEQEPRANPLPVLDERVAEIKREMIDFCVKNQLPGIFKSLWPGGKNLAISITHDIDITRKYGLTALARDFLSANFAALKDHYQKSVFRDNVYWNFENLLNSYREKNITATFYFICKPWEKFHYRYNIKKSKYRQLFQAIFSDNHEIGLHTSRFAFDHPNRIRREKKKLEDVLGREIQGVRQHYLRLLFPEAWDYFETNNFLYDSSCGYNDSSGFRAGTSLPFQTFNFEKEQYRNLYEIPFSLMDYPWKEKRDNGSDMGDFFRKITEPIEKTSGLLNLIWHPHNIVEEEFNELWDYLLTYVEKKDAYKTSLRNIIDWWEKRSGVQLSQFDYQSKSLDIRLNSKFSVKNICLEIISPRELEAREGLQKKDWSLYLLTLPELSTGDHSIRLPLKSN
jgi:peptidoglycan/xylan/chitin deacetylase (PgdA/CDA1 family)